MDIFLHTVTPSSVAFSLGSWNIYWYGIIMAAAIGAAVWLALRLASRFDIESETVIDAAFWIVIAGFIGARLYEIGLEFSFYAAHPLEMLKVWNGGLAIHGGLIGGALGLFFFTRRRKLNLWDLGAVIAPAVALGQAIGRWGNWFNQELFGRPTNLPWGIPITPFKRPPGYETEMYFHPTFLYESIGSLLLFLILWQLVRRRAASARIIGTYLIGYGLLRFSLEYIKIDLTPIVLGLRWPQWASLGLIVLGGMLIGRSRQVPPRQLDI